MNYGNLNDYEILYRVRENDDSAVELMIVKYEPVILSICKKYLNIAKSHGAEMCDLIQEGRIAVIKALNSFDENNKAIFYTYVSLCINRHLISYCRTLSTVKNAALNYSVNDEELYDLGDWNHDPSNVINNLELERKFVDFKYNLDFRDSIIFELRYNGFSYKEIGILLDISYSVVDSRLCKIRKVLRSF